LKEADFRTLFSNIKSVLTVRGARVLSSLRTSHYARQLHEEILKMLETQTTSIMSGQEASSVRCVLCDAVARL
jgi:siroheme synthase